MVGSVVVVIGIVSFLVSLFSSSTNTNQNSTRSKQTVSTDQPEQVTITMKNFAFQPAKKTIPKGSSVTWVNHDDAEHNVVAGDGAFSSNYLKRDQSFSYTFESSGTFSYKCANHPSMTATIIVQ